jgi:hypothetical protein
MARVVRDELQRLGRSLLHIANERAKEQGVSATMVARCGPVRETIQEFVTEVQADALVIGAPRTVSTPQDFGDAGIQVFASQVAEATGAKVVVV